MPGAGYPDDADAVEAERERWDRDSSTRDRVYETVIQLFEPASADEIAERARCSEGAARDHLEWFEARGIVESIDGRPKRYRRNDAYFEWARANELRRAHTDAELERDLRALVTAERSYRDQYEVGGPDQVDALEAGAYDDIEAVWEDIANWKTVRRDIRVIERARKDREAVDGTRTHG